MTLRIQIPPGRRAEREYSVETLCRDFLGLDIAVEVTDREDVCLSADGRELRIADVFFATPEDRWGLPPSLPSLPLETWDPEASLPEVATFCPDIPVLYGDKGDGNTYCRLSPSGIHLAIDIFGSSFYLLTRYEEIVKEDRDGHGRFPAAASTAWAGNFLLFPLVNVYLEVLWACLIRLWPRLERKRRTFRTMVSHDIDSHADLLPENLSEASESLRSAARRAGIKGMAGEYRKWRERQGKRGPAGGNLYEWLMDLAEEGGGGGSFYFKANSRDLEYDKSYRLDGRLATRRMGRILERGHEVGFHPGYYTLGSRDLWLEELGRLKSALPGVPIRGGRQHFLRFSVPETWRMWEEAEMEYDSTLSFPEHAGFRCGVCYEYKVFSVTERRRLNILERPLVIMDKSLTRTNSMALDLREAEKTAHSLRETVMSFHGDFTLLWHIASVAVKEQRDLLQGLVRGERP